MTDQTSPATNTDLPDDKIDMHQAVIENAVSGGVSRYIAQREKMIPEFVRRHYSLRGALRLHRHAFGWDLVRVPLNILWSILRLVLAVTGLLAKLAGAGKLSRAIKRLPSGLETDMDRHIKWLVITELLELPYAGHAENDEKDALMAEITKDPFLESLIEEELQSLHRGQNRPEFRRNLERKLAEYGATRTGAADLASNIMVLVSSKVALGQVAYGALSAGSAVSASLAQLLAVSNFWLGSTAGSYFYAVMPVTVSTRLLIAVTASIAVTLAFVSTFIGIVTDPLQARLGLHQKRLRKLVRAIQKDLEDTDGGDFQLREKYVGRVLDLVDVLTVLGRSV
jgi:ABC-type multidrug transport system fused ATPase/permease subunit